MWIIGGTTSLCTCVCVLDFLVLGGQSVKHNKQSASSQWHPVAVFMCSYVHVLVCLFFLNLLIFIPFNQALQPEPIKNRHKSLSFHSGMFLLNKLQGFSVPLFLFLRHLALSFFPFLVVKGQNTPCEKGIQYSILLRGPSCLFTKSWFCF